MALRMQEHVGRVLAGRYRIVAPIGTGASGHVFLADDITLRRRVAIKVLHATLANDPGFLKRFQAEAQAVAVLNHPNIMRVFDWGDTDDGPFVVLEYLSGGSLRDLLDTGFRMTPSQALLVGLEAARGLDYAHRRGLVHRDIKPANLLFDDEGRLCIADFGIARALAEAAWTEPQGSMLGTARYAAPEQVEGSSVTGKADIYSLSLVLIEAVTGEVPFSADTTIATLMARLNTALEVPEELGPLAEVVEQASTINVDERLDAGKLAELLNDAARELPAPEKLPLTGIRTSDVSMVIDRDPTIMAGVTKRIYDSEIVEKDSQPVISSDAVDSLSISSESWWQRKKIASAERKRMRLVPRKNSKLILTISGVIAAICIGALVLAPQLRPQHKVPVLVGKSLSDARKAAQAVNLNVVLDSERYSDQPYGYVLKQTPSTGKLHEGDNIGVVTSKGPPPRAVPDLTNKTETDATTSLTSAGFVVKREGKRDENVPKGFVLDWTPRGDQPKGSTITLVVSDGPPLRTVPDLAGKSQDEATAALAQVGLKASFVNAYSDTVEVGKVISSSPNAGHGAERDSSVTVYVSKGPETVSVPNVQGMSAQHAADVLTDAGLVVGATYGPPGKAVFATSPAAGAKVKRGTTVNLYTK